MAQQREKAQKKDHEGVSPRPELQRFECEQQQNQRAAGIAAQKGAELRRCQCQRQQQQAGADPARGQGLLLQG